jgi:hypothetical protein
MSSTFTPQRSVLRNIVLSMKSQETIAEVLADSALTYRARMETTAFLQELLEKESDYAYTGKNGKSMATESRLIAQSATFNINTRLDDFLVGWMFAFGMGQEIFTAGAAGPPQLPNTHVFTWDDTDGPSLLTNIYGEDTAGLKRKWSDLALSQFVLTGSDKGSIMVKATGLGLGTVTDGAMATLPALPTAQYLYGSDSTASIGPTGDAVSLAPRVLSWEATFDAQKELFRAVGCGTKPYFIRKGNPINKLKLVIAADTSSDVRDWVNEETPLEVKIAAVSGATSLLIDFPHVILPKYDLGEQDKFVAYTLDLDQQSILQPTGGGESVTVTVQNTDAAYLGAV